MVDPSVGGHGSYKTLFINTVQHVQAYVQTVHAQHVTLSTGKYGMCSCWRRAARTAPLPRPAGAASRWTSARRRPVGDRPRVSALVVARTDGRELRARSRGVPEKQLTWCTRTGAR